MSLIVDGIWPPPQSGRHDALEALTAAVRRLVDATVATGLDADDLRVVAGQVDALAGQLEAKLDADPWRARSYGSGLSEPTRLVGSNVGIGACNPSAPIVHIEVHEDASLTGTVRFGTSHMGPLGRAHGGAVASVLDQLLGITAIAAGRSGMTATMTVKYRRATPLNADVYFEARFLGADGRRSRVEATFFDDEGNVTAEAEALLIAPKTPEISSDAPA